MSGSIATFFGWAMSYQKAHDKLPGDIPAPVLAAYGGCATARRASKKCFAVKKRSMIAVDIIEHLGQSVDELFEADESDVDKKESTEEGQGRQDKKEKKEA